MGGFNKAGIWLCAVAAWPALGAIDLDSEAEPTSAVWAEWQAGLGPTVRECRVSERGSLRCEVDEEVQDIECYGIEASRERRLRVNVLDSAFACEVLPKTQDLSRQWRLLVVGKSGGATRWTLEGRTADQTRAAFRAEMSAGYKVRPLVRSYEVELAGGALAAQGSLFPFGILMARARLDERLVASASYERGVGLGEEVGFGKDIRANLSYRFWKGEERGAAGLFLGYQRRLRGGDPFETARLGLDAEGAWARWIQWRAEFSSGWPSFQAPRRLRADLDLELSVRLGQRQGFQWELAAGLRAEDWIQAGDSWTARYANLRTGLLWRRDFD